MKTFFIFICISLSLLCSSHLLAEKQNKTLVFARGSDSVKLDPHAVSDGESAKVIRQIFETLVTFKSGTLEIAPSLATSWKFSEDKLTCEFTLRQGVKFHDGSECDAEAVVFSFQRYFDENHPAHNAVPLLYQESFSDINSVIKISDYKVAFKLKRPSAPLLNNLTMFAASIISKSSWETHGKGISSNPVGTGPWKFSLWRRDELIILHRNADYWGDRDISKKTLSTQINKLIFKVVPESQTRLSLLSRGEAHIADNVEPEHVVEATKNSNVTVQQQNSLNVGYLAFNNERPHMSDLKVRQAIAHAINTEELTKALFQGYAEQATSLLPPGMWGGDPSIQPYEYDVEKAKKLLFEAGLSKGLEVKLSIGSNSRPYLPSPYDAAILIKAALKKINVDVEIDNQPWASYLEFTKNGKHEMCLLGWSSDNGDPDNFLWPLLSISETKKPANNVAFYKNKQVNNWLDEARSVISQEERTVLYQKALNQVHKDVPSLPLAHSQQIVLCAKNLEGFVLHPDGVRMMPHLNFSEVIEVLAPHTQEDSSETGWHSIVLKVLAGVFVLGIILYLYTLPRKAR